ncbi:MAG: 2-C-methyl-D-erythritol 2,4-cyclodiphosphate synthase [Chloroflexota bacterium]|nr:MAG: 2-C-methyl-D-erythritol 2,4-cyclodiphosphate synthase [Chloroflexota bacterium]
MTPRWWSGPATASSSSWAPTTTLRSPPRRIWISPALCWGSGRGRSEGLSLDLRVGIGYDVHRFAEGRRLVLGGVDVPFERGLLGHSDADVATHALMDALLGAACLGDIGQHFPPSDPTYKDISSLFLLGRVGRLLSERGWQIVNLDVSIIAQRPRLAEHLPAMRREIGRVLGLDAARVSLKATTSDQLGFTGRGEGIAACAVALLKLENP